MMMMVMHHHVVVVMHHHVMMVVMHHHVMMVMVHHRLAHEADIGMKASVRLAIAAAAMVLNIASPVIGGPPGARPWAQIGFAYLNAE